MKPINLLLSGWFFLNSAHQFFTATSEKESTGLAPVYTIACPVSNVNFQSRSSFGFTTQGFVAITKDRTTLVCYDFDGDVLWKRQPPEKVISAVSVSGDGSKIVAHYPLSEDAAIVEVMTSEGTVMWRDQFEAGFRLSHQGKYLYSGWDMLDGNPSVACSISRENICELQMLTIHSHHQKGIVEVVNASVCLLHKIFTF